MVEPAIYKPRIEWFVQRMEAKMGLPKNVAKGDWRNSNPEDIAIGLGREVMELAEAIRDSEPPENIINECADIANYCMMLADKVKEGVK